MHMSSVILINNLPTLFLPQRLASITSVEIVLDLKQRNQPAETPLLVKESISKIVQAIERGLPNLQKLQIDLMHCYPFIMMDYNKRSIDAESDIFPQFDAMVNRMQPRLKDFTLGVAESVFYPRYDAGRLKDLNLKYSRSSWAGNGDTVWRSISSNVDDALEVDRGYILRQSEYDVYRVYMCTMGEGGYFPGWRTSWDEAEGCVPGTTIAWAYK